MSANQPNKPSHPVVTHPHLPPAFPPRPSYSSLSVKDVLEAREAYHVHLSSMENVAATAVGRYFFHADDWYAKNPPDIARGELKRDAPKTLMNTVVRPWSWPCVLVFVREWLPREKLCDHAVPRRLYLPDGRVVPTCVVLAPPDESLPEPAKLRGNASGLVGGGYQCLRKAQGVERVGTIACLVQRDGVLYGLTNKHVAGDVDDDIESIIRGRRRVIGTTEGLALTKRTLHDIFPDWPGERSYVNVDAGLFRVEDASSWTAQIFGIGELGEVFSATPHTVTLDLIGQPVRAFGGASGVLEGDIKALFFRYKSMGGYDYLADLLIGPRREASEIAQEDPGAAGPGAQSHAGDSGTLWFYDPPRRAERRAEEPPAERGARARRLRPLAMQWGGERIKVGNEQPTALALATFLSTVCRELDVEVVRDWCTGYSEYWGKLAHFAIGWKACDLVEGKLGELMRANQERIGFPDETLREGAGFKVGRKGFVPLADVPDYVWVSASEYVPSRKHEGQQHFADVDIVPPGRQTTILDACVADSRKVSAKYWKESFDAFAQIECGPDEGTLPFRVWQIWDAMVGYLRKHDYARFVAAAGVLAHYVGDASMPFHCSWLHHGYLPMKTVNGKEYPVPHKSDEYEEYSKSREAKIHSIYDEGIMEIDTQGALTAVDGELGAVTDDITSGHEAAVAAVHLMNEMRANLKAEDIIAADDPTLGPKDRSRRLWSNEKVRDAAVKSMAASTQLVARLWASAWKKAGKANGRLPEETAFTEERLESIYRDAKFLPAMDLAMLVEDGSYEPPAKAGRKGRAEEPVAVEED